MINVVLKKGCDYKAFTALLDQHGYSYKQYGSGRILSIETDKEMFKLSGHPNIESCEAKKYIGIEPALETRTLPNTYHDRTETINEDSWGLARLCRRNNPYYNPRDGYSPNPVSSEYAFSRTGLGVDCYLIDAGIHPSNPEFSGRVTWVSDGSTTRIDTASNHGNAVASNMAGVNVGPAKDALIWFVQTPPSDVYDSDLIGQYDQVLQHYLSRAHTNRPAVLNHSFAGVNYGGTRDADSFAAGAMIAELIDAGIVVGVAAGNANTNADNELVYPAEYDPDIIMVGAHSSVDCIYDKSIMDDISSLNTGTSTGANVDIYAPGVSISCAYQDSGYVQWSGTSMATPYTMGVLACMLQGYQRLNHREQVRSVVRKLIQNSTKDKLRYNPSYKGIVHNRILYMDPTKSFEIIPGLERL